MSKHFIFDFDSTFIRVEALDILCEIAQAKNPGMVNVLSQIQHLTNLGMEGRLSLKESLLQRIQLLNANKSHLAELITALKLQISDSVKRNHRFFAEHADKVYVISNGFKEIIAPIVLDYGISPDRVLANSFHFDAEGNIIGFDQSNPLCENKGKAIRLKAVGLTGDIMVIK